MADKWNECIEDIRVPDTETRKYRYLELLNQLKVVLISDEEAKKGAAALTVQAGYLSDPEDLPGLAHFCEHMLFLGTEKYPSENAYQEFLSQHGGSSNAFTAADRATYFFDVSHEYLRGALDRFVQFFLHPLFNESATEREVQAVDTENSGNLQVDTWRVKQVIHETARPGHPFRKFGTGNKETLMSLPSSRGQDVRKELLEFHSQYYSSNLMGLAVHGKESLDELSDMVVELFSGICNKNVPVPIVTEAPFSMDELQVCLEVVPVKHRRELVVSFPLPDLQKHFRAKPVDYVSHLIGHEGEGSILSLLKAKGWCSALSAGGTAEARGLWMYNIECGDLTEEGEAHVEDMIEIIFQYIAMLRREGPKEWIFKECSGVHEIQFRYADQLPPNHLVTGVSDCILRLPPRELATGLFIMTEYKPELISDVLELLTPQNLRYMVVSQSFAGKTDKVEPWYKVDYNIKKIDAKLIDKWSALTPVDALHLPSKNEFIPTNFDLVQPPENAPNVPVIIKEAPGVTVFHKVDDKFKVPKAAFYFELASPLSRQAPENAQLVGLFVLLLNDSLNEYAYAADIAGLEYDFEASMYGVQLTLAGYSDGLEVLLLKIVEKMTKLEVDPMKFVMYKEQMYRKLKNFQAEQPYSHAWYYTTMLLVDHCWRKEELMTALEGLTIENLRAFIPTFLSQLQITALAFGNVSQADTLRVVSQVQTTLGCRPLGPGQMTRLRQVQIPVGSKLVYEAENTVHNTSCIDMYWQVGMEDVSSNMLLELLVQVMKEPCYDQLRTKEQLGYLIHTSMRRANGVQGLQLLVQSPKHPAFVEGRIEAFLKSAEEIISAINDASFTEHCHALATRRLDKPKSFVSKSKEYWSEITTGFYHFERDDVEIEHLKHTTKEDLVEFFKNHIAAGGQYRRKLAVRVHSQSTKTAGAESTDSISAGNVHSDVIADVHKFKERQSLYPRPAPCVEPTRALTTEEGSSHKQGEHCEESRVVFDD